MRIVNYWNILIFPRFPPWKWHNLIPLSKRNVMIANHIFWIIASNPRLFVRLSMFAVLLRQSRLISISICISLESKHPLEWGVCSLPILTNILNCTFKSSIIFLIYSHIQANFLKRMDINHQSQVRFQIRAAQPHPLPHFPSFFLHMIHAYK